MNRRLAAFLMVVLAGSILWGGTAWGAANNPLWEQTFNFLPNYDQGWTTAIASTGTTVIVCGEVYKSPHQDSIGFIKAYDIATGNPKWQGVPLTLANIQSANYNGNEFGSIMLNGNIALVMGAAISITYPTGGGLQETVNLDKNVLRAYNADTGVLLWEDIRDGGGGNMAGSNVPATMANNRAFVSGFNRLTGNIFVRAYKINTSLSGLPLLLE